MSIVDGQSVNAAVTNPAFLSANADDTGIGKIDLANVADPASGPTVVNIQREINSLDSFTGRTAGSAYNIEPTFTNSQGFTATENLLERVEAISALFNSTSGHTHDGTPGSGGLIDAANLDSVPLRGFVIQGIDLSAVTGSSVDVSTELTGATPSTGPTVLGVVVNAPQNKSIIRQASGVNENDVYTDGLGNVVYARLTESTGVWTLSFYVDLSGTETAYSFAVASDVRWYYQELFNPMVNPPVYSEFANIPSDNVTQDVVDATTSYKGKVQLGNTASTDIASSGTIGTTNATVANADHTHRGVSAVKEFVENVNAYGDVTLRPSGSITISRSGSEFTFGGGGAANASALSFTPTGSISATNTQAAVAEVSGDVDTHIGATAAHGATGAVVGTTNTQTLTNKDIDGGTASNTSRITIPKDTKANLDALTRKEGTVVYATDTDKLYYDDGSILKPVGSGSGGGINFMPLSTTWSSDNQDNVDFETTIGNWVTYDNGAVAIPTTMTGGSPTVVSIARTTSAGQVLNGSASMLISKTAADAQGEGTSCVFNVPPAYSGKRAKIQIPFRVLSGSLVQGDVQVFVYDVTNSNLITPFNNDMVGSNGTIEAYYDVPNSTANVQMRVGFHFASTSTTAVTFVVDDVIVEPLDLISASVTTAWQSYTPVFGGCTPTGATASYYQNGNTLVMKGSGVMASTSGTTFSVSMPVGFVASGPASVYAPVGTVTRGNSGDPAPKVALITDGATVVNFASISAPLTPVGANTMANGETFTFGPLIIPIQNIAGATLTNLSTRTLSQILATGTRVTSAPTKLGEYRARYKSGATSNTLTDVAPTTPPSSSGFTIDAANYASAQTSGLISVWDFYIGLNKDFKFFTPGIYSDFNNVSSTVASGINVSYDKSTGVLTIDAGTNETSNTTRYVGKTAGTNTGVSTIVADVTFSDAGQALAMVAPNSSVVFNTGQSANGSTNTTVRRFANVSVVGNGLSANQSSTLGDSVVVIENGTYSISYTEVCTGVGGNYFAITKNGTALSSGPELITYAQGFLAGNYTGYDEMIFVGSVTIPLVAGDVIRFQRVNARISTSSRVIGIVTQVSKG